ncbi:diguanylate cyclase [Aureimonas sp. AU12]|uniref:GGDEF domain-containing protein n=1 Tax=Aureimonas sp. AU12 TaxID=1638161 RepID=UPI000783302E|nr:GGDEF domain-containing protein [Aureimonas sp. AU12]
MRRPNALVLFRAGAAVLLVCAGLLGYFGLRVALESSSTADRSLEQLKGFEIAFTALSAVTAERLPTEAVLAADSGFDDNELARMTQARRTTDEALKRLESSLTEFGWREPPNFNFLSARLRSERQRVDLMKTTPLHERRVGEQGSIIRGFISLSESAEPFVDVAAKAVIAADTDLGGQVTMARLLGAMHEAAVRLSSEVMPTIAAKVVIPIDLQSAVLRTQQRILALWDVGASQLESAPTHERLAKALAAIRGDYFGKGFSFLQRIVERQSIRVNPSLNARRISALYEQTTQPIAELRDLYVAEMVDGARARQKEALTNTVVTLVLTLTMLAVVPWLGWIAYREVLRPLLVFRSQIVAICERKTHAETPYFGTVPQVRGLYRALQTLWELEREREAIDRERQILSERLRVLSETDQLTGLLNRRGLEVALAELDRGASASLAFLLFDIDYFKAINDSFGHGMGDRVLQALARILSQASAPGVVAARYGGEEFAVAVADWSQTDVLALAEEIRREIECCRIPNGAEAPLQVTASCGLAVASCPDADWGELIVQADAALYAAKAAGRNRVRATNAILSQWTAQTTVEPDADTSLDAVLKAS